MCSSARETHATEIGMVSFLFVKEKWRCVFMAGFIYLFTLLAFMVPAISHSTAPSFRLHAVDLGNSLAPEDRKHYEVIFGKLNEQQVRELHRKYHTAFHGFDAQKEYQLQDFLPQSVQMVLGKKIQNPQIAIPQVLVDELIQANQFEPMQNYETGMNCHSFSYQFIRMWQSSNNSTKSFQLYGVDDLKLYQEVKNFPVVTEKEAKIGDLLIISSAPGFANKSGILHSAIYLGDGLVVEKIDYDSIYPFRIAKLSDVKNKYSKVAEDMAVDFYSIENASALPVYHEKYSFAHQSQISDIPEVQNLASKVSPQSTQYMLLLPQYQPLEEIFKYELVPYRELRPEDMVDRKN